MFNRQGYFSQVDFCHSAVHICGYLDLFSFKYFSVIGSPVPTEAESVLPCPGIELKKTLPPNSSKNPLIAYATFIPSYRHPFLCLNFLYITINSFHETIFFAWDWKKFMFNVNIFPIIFPRFIFYDDINGFIKMYYILQRYLLQKRKKDIFGKIGWKWI